jgi:hypothetical protein
MEPGGGQFADLGLLWCPLSGFPKTRLSVRIVGQIDSVDSG